MNSHLNGSIWFFSDPHFYHRNISGVNRSDWKSGYRDFENEDVMTDVIINTINKHVNWNDTLWCLGDWSFGGVLNVQKARDRINCADIHLILGNHDHNIIMHKECRDCFSSVQATKMLYYQKKATPIFLSHYSHRVWEGSHKGYIHLYGHSHDSIPDYGKSIDVGVDAAYRRFGEYRPFKLEEILDIMANREVEFPDHHDAKTNVK